MFCFIYIRGFICFNRKLIPFSFKLEKTLNNIITNKKFFLYELTMIIFIKYKISYYFEQNPIMFIHLFKYVCKLCSETILYYLIFFI